MMHELIPIDENAPFPVSYQAVITALEQCDSLDECKDWADKAVALKSYARQAGDPRLKTYAMRIQGRAVRRCGELLKEFDARGAHRKTMGDHSFSQREAAAEAGLSLHQQFQAVEVANIPSEQFERLTESENPPSVTALASIGKRSRPVERPPGYADATNFIDLIARLARFCDDHPSDVIAAAIDPDERPDVLGDMATVAQWNDRLMFWIEQNEREESCRVMQ